MTPIDALCKPYVEEVVRALLAVLPDEWTTATLTVERTVASEGLYDAHKIVSSEDRQLAQPDDRVFEATGQLASFCAKYGEPWARLKLDVRWNDASDRWSYDIALEPAGEASDG